VKIILTWLQANQAYVFIAGKGPRSQWSYFRMGDNPMFFESLDEAQGAAERQGLIVEKDGTVRRMHSGGMLNGLAGEPLRWRKSFQGHVATKFVRRPGHDEKLRLLIVRNKSVYDRRSSPRDRLFSLRVQEPTGENAVSYGRDVKLGAAKMLASALIQEGRLELV
jgi:hypothetical protein